MVALQSVAITSTRMLGTKLSRIVTESADDLTVDFPTVVSAYETPEAATSRLNVISDQIRAACGLYDAYAVCSTNGAVGLVTYAQRSLWVPAGWKLAHMNGPLIAGWLGSNRSNDERRIGLRIMRLLAEELIQPHRRLVGTAWTVVRPQNSTAVRRVEAVDNGFGGFRPVGKPRDYRRIDGVPGARQLYVANHGLAELATNIV